MIAKNRDELSGLQSIVIFHPNKGYRFLALVSQQKIGSPDVIRSGINQYGLSIVNMATGYVLAGYPNYNAGRYDDGDDFMRDVLTHYRSVAEVVAHLSKLVDAHPYPEFYLLADSKEIALVEIAPDSQYSVTVSNQVPLYHTNHYITSNFAGYNLNQDVSSIMRYNRIATLMQGTSDYSINTFIGFAHDHQASDEDSIFRVNSEPAQPRTLATFIAEIPKNDNAPTVYVQFYPKPVTQGVGPIDEYVLDKTFWKLKGKQKVLATEVLTETGVTAS